MNDQVKAPALPNEDEVLAFTHEKRIEVLKMLMASGKLPEDPAEKKLVVTLLKDMDGAALGRKRIKVDEKVASSQTEAAGLIARVLQAAARANPYHVIDAPSREVPVLGSEVPPPRVVEGEMAVVGGASESYETFVARTQGVDVPGSSTD